MYGRPDWRCRAAEDLMLTDEALAIVATDWPAMRQKIQSWVAGNPQHQYHADMQAFVRRILGTLMI